jgi:Tfp pilus assembly protein PilF
VADLYLVTRLDGYTAGDVIGLIDRAQTPAQGGKIVLDQKGTGVNRAGDQWLERAAETLNGIGAHVVLERTTALAERETGVIGYYSWGSNDPSFRVRRVNMSFAPGAIAATFVSTDARTFREPPETWTIGDWNNRATYYAGSPQSLIADLLREGVTGAAGHVAEPFLDATIRPQILFPAYLSGFNLAESFYLAMPYVSWQTVVIGDPLCAPFRKAPVSTTEIDSGIDPLTELPKLFSARRVEQLSAAGGSPQIVTLLVKATGRLARGDRDGARAGFEEALRLDPKLTSAEKALALLDDQDGRYVSAIEHYRRVVGQSPDDVLSLNNLAFLIATRTPDVGGALVFAERAATLAPREVNVLDTLAWVHYLNGNARRADVLLQQARQADVRNADVWLHSSAVHLALGDAATAARALAEALRLDASLSTRDDVLQLQSEIKKRHSF